VVNPLNLIATYECVLSVYGLPQSLQGFSQCPRPVTDTERSTKDSGISRLAFFNILVAKRRSAIGAQDADPSSSSRRREGR
jgi:hypothetical protein